MKLTASVINRSEIGLNTQLILLKIAFLVKRYFERNISFSFKLGHDKIKK